MNARSTSPDHPPAHAGAEGLRPSLVSWNITRRCNLTCAHCYRDARERPDLGELTTAEGLNLIEEITRAGFRVLVLSGGEPLIRADLCDLIGAARALGLRPVLGSNGTLITEAAAQRMRDAGLARAGISLDSADASYHNALRGSPTAWQGAIAGMRACAAVGLPFQVNTTITRQNEQQMLEITDLAVELGAAGHHVFFLVPTGRGKEIAEDMVQAARYEELLTALMRKQQEIEIEIKPTCAPQFLRIADTLNLRTRFRMGCLAGRTYCVITPTGDVHPCPYLPVGAGNVRELPFSSIWETSELLRQLRGGALQGMCGRCRWSQRCFGCRARAYWATGGNMMAEDPWCALVVRRRTASAEHRPQSLEGETLDRHRMAHTERPLFPAFIALHAKLCVVVGGGEVAARKIRSLLGAGARVLVIAPELCAEMEALLRAPDVTYRRREYAAGDLEGSALVFAATDDPDVNAAVYRDAVERGILVNVVDDSAHCSFVVPSQVTRGGVCIAISTQGQSPALARHLRARVEEAVPPSYGELAALLGRLRAEVKAAVPSPEERARRWDAVLESGVLSLIEQGRTGEAEELARSILGLAADPGARAQ
jgi:putative heme d1 biosynthesis radical SAM protein NirJ2